MKNLTIKAKLYIILAIGTLGSLLVGYYVNSTFGEIASSNSDIQSGLTAINIYIAVLIVIDAAVVMVVGTQINNSVKSISAGIQSFFSFIEQKTDDYQAIEIKNMDELGLISQELNKHATLTKEMLEMDRKLIDELDDVLEKIDNGFFMYKVKSKTTNQQLETLKSKINNLSGNINRKLNVITQALMEFGNSNFDYHIDEKEEMNGSYGSLKASTKLIGNNVSELLAMIMKSGTKLDEGTTTLSHSSSSLSAESNTQAASLEETAAALEEVTATISNNSSDIKQMSVLSNSLIDSVKEGENLAQKTNMAMDEINKEVTSISEAISVIDQIAFQTNILSLNAAVEAATAGEAGKGFAVVAQEVRNLASRSAEAAAEIKDIVETASKKANSGKVMADDMIKGYQVVNDHIEETTSLISNVSNSSKEQESAIHQINDAVAQLDQATQKNASEANTISDLASEISSLSQGLVTAANKAKYDMGANELVEDVDLVFTTAKLKNDHIKFKEGNYSKLGNNQKWTVTDHHNCALGKWIDQAEKEGRAFTKTTNWEKMKKEHEKVHSGVQNYVTKDEMAASNEQLQAIATEIEASTLGVFSGLNNVKLDNNEKAA